MHQQILFSRRDKLWYMKADSLISLHCPSLKYSTISKTRFIMKNKIGFAKHMYLKTILTMKELQNTFESLNIAMFQCPKILFELKKLL